MLLVVLLVIFVVVMLVWALINAGSISGNGNWLAFIAVLVLGVVVFLTGTGVVVYKGFQ